MREPVAEGFYPGEPRLLERLVSEACSQARKQKGKRLAGLVAPHAGYVYCAPLMGRAYGLASRTTRRVIILAPDHNGIATGPGVTLEEWKTPLGVVEPDSEAIQELLDEGVVSDETPAHEYEFSIEVQLPFIQHATPRARIVPVIIPSGTRLSTLTRLGEAINSLIDGRTLVVATTDLTHYGEGYGFTVEDADPLEWVEETDTRILESMARRNIPELMRTASTSNPCGIQGVIVLIQALRGREVEGIVLGYGNTFQKTGNKRAIKGYGSVAYLSTSNGK